MINIAAHYIFDGENFLKNAFISVNEDGLITYISEPGEAKVEKPKMLFLPGIILPGLINSHCHLELSGYPEFKENKKDLAYFIDSVIKHKPETYKNNVCDYYDKLMFDLGINYVGDIVNTDVSLKTKQNSKIFYHNFIELIGINPNEVNNKIEFALNLKNIFNNINQTSSIVPHSFYSLSKELFTAITNIENNNPISIHLFESLQEVELVYNSKGELLELMKKIYPEYQTFVSNIKDICDYLSKFLKSNIILVHNTYAEQNNYCSGEHIYYCLCPSSNIFMHGNLPSKEFVYNNLNKIILGTDSLASNTSLDILAELKIFAEHYNIYDLKMLLKLVTGNASKAFKTNNFGFIKENISPGVLLLENVDLINLKLLKESNIKRII